jgi:hypothetical protein
MRVEVDQSGKIEDTRVSTVPAFSNGVAFSVLIPANVKGRCVQELRRWGLRGPTFYA